MTWQGGRLWLAVLAVSVLLAGFASWRLAGGGSSQMVAEQTSPAPAELSPSTTQPSPVDRPSRLPRDAGRPGVPGLLAIPRLSLEMPIVPVKVDRDGAMALPQKPTEIGWYAYGPRPGERGGSAVLGGHIDSRQYGIGPLTALRRLHKGDEVVVRTVSTRHTFRVVSVRLIRKQALPLRTLFDRDGDQRLRIITCGGPYIRSRGGYQNNVVVTAVPERVTPPPDRSMPRSPAGKVQG
jgi:LPXTG-site transpeptidase (sortase) family protein